MTAGDDRPTLPIPPLKAGGTCADGLLLGAGWSRPALGESFQFGRADVWPTPVLDDRIAPSAPK